MRKQIEETPENLRPRLFLASLFITYRLFDEAIIEIEEAFKISDKKQDMFFLLATAYLNSGKTEKALEVTRRAFDLEPSNARARKIYSTLLIRSGREKEAEELLSLLDETDYLSDPQIVSAYASIKKFDKLISFWEGRIKQEPGNPQAYISLSAAYLESGNRKKAVEKLETAIALFPAFKEQGEFFVREIKAGRNP